MDLPERKQNRLENYNYGQNGAYFITICTQNRKRILSAIVGDGFPVPKLLPSGRIVYDMIKEIPEKYNDLKIDNYVIMPDHIHLLISIINGTGNPSPTIGKAIGWFKYCATKKINQTNGTQGDKVFQRSYYDHVIRNEQDYTETWEYIENNPIRWMMKNNETSV